MESRLVRPDPAYERSFREMLEELGPPDPSQPSTPERLAFRDFREYVRRLRSLSDRPFDGVPRDILWLVEGDEFLGRATVTHVLTERMRDQGGNISYFIRPSARRKGYGSRILALALEHARAIGLSEVLITVLSNNPASERVIHTVGGRLDSVTDLENGVQRRRYIVAL